MLNKVREYAEKQGYKKIEIDIEPNKSETLPYRASCTCIVPNEGYGSWSSPGPTENEACINLIAFMKERD